MVPPVLGGRDGMRWMGGGMRWNVIHGVCHYLGVFGCDLIRVEFWDWGLGLVDWLFCVDICYVPFGNAPD